MTNYTFRQHLTYLLMLHDVDDLNNLIDLEGWQYVDEAIQRQNGAVLLFSHVGFPRLLRWYLQSRGHPVHHLVKMGFRTGYLSGTRQTGIYGLLDQWLRARFLLDTDDLIGQDDLSARYMKRALDHLKQNGLVTIAGDGWFGDSRTPVTMCGREFSFPLGSLSLGVMSHSRILPCFTTIDARPRFGIQIQPPLSSPTGVSRSEQLRGLATEYAARLEDYIVHHPTNVFHHTYRVRPPATVVRAG